MEGYQFAHIETYSAKGKSAPSPDEFYGKRKNGQKAWTAQEIIDELERLEHASQHVIPGRPGPEIIPGDVDNFVDLRAAQKKAAAVKTWASYAQPDGSVVLRERKLRVDTASIYASVVSLPVRTEDALSDPLVRARAVKVLRKAITHDRERIEKAGGRFMMAVVHWDEEFLHAHIMALDPVRGAVKHLHPGYAAKAQVEETSAGRKIPKAQVNKLGNIAYCDAMRGWQDDFYAAVFKDAGLLRYGPRRERLSTPGYKRAKESARLRAEDEQRRAELESAEARITDELDRAKVATATAEQKAEAIDAGTAAVLEEKIAYRPATAEKSEGLKFGSNAPSDPKDRNQLARRIQPAFEVVVKFAKKMASLNQMKASADRSVAAAETILAKAQENRMQVDDREVEVDRSEALFNWKSRALAKVVRSMRDWVPKPVQFVVDALERGEDPVAEKTAAAFPGAWSIPKNPDRRALQRKLDDMTNASLSKCFSGTQDAYLLTDGDRDRALQGRYATGVRLLFHEARQRGLDLETGRHDPAKALSKDRAHLHIDTPPTPIRVKRKVRDRQLVR